jgi:hypothetical protein
MEKEGQEPSGKLPQAAEGGGNQSSGKKRAIVALTRILGSGPLDEESLRLLEQLADCIQHPRAEVLQEPVPTSQAASQQITTTEEESAEAEPAEMTTGEPSHSGDPEHNSEEGVIMGSLRSAPTDRWMCRVPSCTGKFHRLKELSALPQNGTRGEAQAGRFAQSLPGVSDPGPRPSRQGLPLRGRAS